MTRPFNRSRQGSLRILAAWTLLGLGCDRSICQSDPAKDGCPHNPLTVVCSAPGGVLSLRGTNLLTVTPSLLPGDDVQAWLVTKDQSVPIPRNRLSIPAKGQLQLDLTAATRDSALAMVRVGSTQVKVQVGTDYSGTADLCELAVPVEFVPSPAKLHYNGRATPTPMQAFALQYGGLAGLRGRLYITELVPAASRRLARFILSPDGMQLIADPDWPMALVMSPNRGGQNAKLAATSADFLLYDGLPPDKLDLNTNTLDGTNFHPTWSTTVAGVPTSGIGLAAAVDVERFLIAESSRVLLLSHRQGMNVQVTPVSGLIPSGILGVTMRTAPPRLAAVGGSLVTAEAAAFSANAVEVLTFDSQTLALGPRATLSNAATQTLASSLNASFASFKLAMADLDDDGYQDLLVLDGNGSIWWAAQVAPDSFAVPKATGVTVANAIAFTVGDLDGDGVADLAVVASDQGNQTSDVLLFMRK